MSITLLVTGYLCIAVAVEQIRNATAMGVAGIMGVVRRLTVPAGGWVFGLVLYFMVEHRSPRARVAKPEEPIAVEDDMAVETDDGREPEPVTC